MTLEGCVLHAQETLTEEDLVDWEERKWAGSSSQTSQRADMTGTSSLNVLGEARLHIDMKSFWPRGEPGRPGEFSSMEGGYGPLNRDADVEILEDTVSTSEEEEA